MTADEPGEPIDAGFDPRDITFHAGRITFQSPVPTLDGRRLTVAAPQVAELADAWRIDWAPLDASSPRASLLVTRIAAARALRLELSIIGLPANRDIDSLGLQFERVGPMQRYLRNGYTSWDGSYFVPVESAQELGQRDPRILAGHVMTAIVAEPAAGNCVHAAVIGVTRTNRFQSVVAFEPRNPDSASLRIETLLDRVPHGDSAHAEPVMLLADANPEAALRRWAKQLATESTPPPRLRARRISGWCSWYNLYASIDERVLLEHLRAAADFRDRHRVPMSVFQIDDGFTPEMGDWLDFKPQFPRGMAPLLAEVRAAGFVPGLWMAPFMIGNRSRLYAEHPDWVVRRRDDAHPITPMRFFGEFRWHKRSEEYYVLDVTHPDAAAWIHRVLRTWANDWGCGYFKTDFMHFGSDYGPADARWHRPGLSRMQIWMTMAELIRDAIGPDALWLACGGPIWAPVGLVDAVRIGRDIGVAWRGDRSAESLLRDQTTRGFANGVLWQSDPDCVLLRSRFHELSDDEVNALARFAATTGGVLMTSDHLGELSPARAALWAELLRDDAATGCVFPDLGIEPSQIEIVATRDGAAMPRIRGGRPVLRQQRRRAGGAMVIHYLNTSDSPVELQLDSRAKQPGPSRSVPRILRPHESCIVELGSPSIR